MDAIRIWRTIRRNLVDYGVAVTIGKSFRKILSPIYENLTYRIYCIDLENVEKVEEQLNARYALQLIQYDDEPTITKIESMAEWLKGEIKNKLCHDHICIIVLDGDRLAGFNLISLNEGHIPLLKIKWELPEEEAWSEHIAVGREYRRQGLALALRNKAFEELLDRGIKRFCGGALISNQKSLGLAKRAGYRFIEDRQYIKIFGFKKWYRREVTE